MPAAPVATTYLPTREELEALVSKLWEVEGDLIEMKEAIEELELAFTGHRAGIAALENGGSPDEAVQAAADAPKPQPLTEAELFPTLFALIELLDVCKLIDKDAKKTLQRLRFTFAHGRDEGKLFS